MVDRDPIVDQQTAILLAVFPPVGGMGVDLFEGSIHTPSHPYIPHTSEKQYTLLSACIQYNGNPIEFNRTYTHTHTHRSTKQGTISDPDHAGLLYS